MKIMETKVGVKEFRANLPTYLESSSPVAITRHGETIGYYIPARGGRKQAELDALREAAATLDSMMSALRISEDDIAGDFKARRAADKR
ncbi:MAG: type II toxin-antitoxin system Phd/YefM family antitoxin [Burkholderiaceae bacterium]|nr:type II toxin-antitoxin system Phd/YefM family antitoxin [Burkholderiaceae bacterium]